MTALVEMRFGSQLYGTATPASDLDLKAVHLPDASAILLQRVRPVVVSKTKADPRAKNTADDVDFESFTLQRFLGLCAEGQTVALDMLFAPDWAFTSEPSPIWRDIQANRDKLVTSRCAAFVGYCRTQANRYGIRGSRVHASRLALTLLDFAVTELGTSAKLSALTKDIEALTAETEHMELVDRPQANGQPIRHWSVCGKMMPYTATIKSAAETMRTLVDNYGHRALAAEQNQGVDWKALSHAVRIARQAIELLGSGRVTFPRPDAEHLLAIKLGRLPYAEVAAEIERLLPAVEAASGASTLRDAADQEWIDALVARSHRDVIAAAT